LIAFPCFLISPLLSSSYTFTQTDSTVVVTIGCKNRSKDEVKVTVTDSSCGVKVQVSFVCGPSVNSQLSNRFLFLFPPLQMPDKSTFEQQWKLFAPVQAQATKYDVTADALVLTLTVCVSFSLSP
jgi:hypothetical protein